MVNAVCDMNEMRADPAMQLYARLRARETAGQAPADPPSLREWMQYWNDDDSAIGNLRTLEHWLSRRQLGG
jgi:hypothetical protein